MGDNPGGTPLVPLKASLVDANNLDEAIGISGKLPASLWGKVEIQPVLEVPGIPQN